MLTAFSTLLYDNYLAHPGWIVAPVLAVAPLVFVSIVVVYQFLVYRFIRWLQRDIAERGVARGKSELDDMISACYISIMREHMSITIEMETAKRLRRYALRERRPVSQVVEIAIERLLQQQMPASEKILATGGSFRGTFSREDTYESR